MMRNTLFFIYILTITVTTLIITHFTTNYIFTTIDRNIFIVDTVCTINSADYLPSLIYQISNKDPNLSPK